MTYTKEKVLITVKTYPQPSTTHQELVCTAGVREDGTFIRLYPIDYRYRPYWQWYKKYQWIEVEVTKNDKDHRKESYRPKVDSIRPLTEPLSTKRNWEERKKYVLAKGPRTIEELKEFQSQDNTSLGIVRPKEITDFSIEVCGAEWKGAWEDQLKQKNLFGPDNKPLEKIPFKFSYSFKCDDNRCTGHTMMIEDWEVGELYRHMKLKYTDPAIAAQKVKGTFFDKMCAADVDTHFFVGTVLSHGTWVILGVFWPKKHK
jgi:hypothetical protein